MNSEKSILGNQLVVMSRADLDAQGGGYNLLLLPLFSNFILLFVMIATK